MRLRSLTEPFLDVDASTPMGEAIIGIMAVLAQLRMSTIRENTRRGLRMLELRGVLAGVGRGLLGIACKRPKRCFRRE